MRSSAGPEWSLQGSCVKTSGGFLRCLVQASQSLRRGSSVCCPSDRPPGWLRTLPVGIRNSGTPVANDTREDLRKTKVCPWQEGDRWSPAAGGKSPPARAGQKLTSAVGHIPPLLCCCHCPPPLAAVPLQGVPEGAAASGPHQRTRVSH